MDADLTPAAPAAEATPPALTPSQQAVADNNFTAFRQAERDKRHAKASPALEAPPADSPPAVPADQAVSTETNDKPASEPAKPKNAETRKAELAADIETDLRRRADLRAEIAKEEARLAALKAPPKTDDLPPVSSPAAATFSFPEYDAYVAQHPEATYTQYLDARDVARDAFKDQKRQADERAKTDQEQATQRQAAAERLHVSWKTRVDAAKAKHADYETVALQAPLAPALHPSTLIGGWILDSPLGAEVLYHLQSHPDDVTSIAALTPSEQLRALVKLEDRLTAPPPKPVSDAPPPASTLGSRPADPGDRERAAVASGDFGAFRRIQRENRERARGR